MVETVQQYWPKGRSCVCKRRSVRPLQQHFNRLALWVFKKKIIWKLGAILYKTILIKKTKQKKHYIYLQTHAHTQSLHSLSQTRHITSDHNHCCLHCSDGPASFSVECQSTWGPTGKQTKQKKKQRKPRRFPSTPAQFVFTKKLSFVHEQVSDMQTSTLSRNKYTRKSQKELVGRS